MRNSNQKRSGLAVSDQTRAHPETCVSKPNWSQSSLELYMLEKSLLDREMVRLNRPGFGGYQRFNRNNHRQHSSFADIVQRGKPQHRPGQIFSIHHHDARYGSFSTLLRSSFNGALPYFADGRIDLLHIDGFHTYEAVSGDFKAWQPELSPRAVVLFHGINVRDRGFGIWRFWEELASNHPHFRRLLRRIRPNSSRPQTSYGKSRAIRSQLAGQSNLKLLPAPHQQCPERRSAHPVDRSPPQFLPAHWLARAWSARSSFQMGCTPTRCEE